MKQPIPSEAFELAALRSERVRIVAMIGIGTLLLGVNVVRAIAAPEEGNRAWLAFAGPLLTAFLVYEGLMLWIASRALRHRRPVPIRMWAVNTVLETSLPTAALFGLTGWESHLGPYRALLSPVVIVYCVFIVLSTLRLRPTLCLLAGAVSAAGYFCVFAWTRRNFPDAPARRFMPVDAYYTFPFALFVCGVIAGMVARQVRGHVIAALDEAETRRRLDQIEQELRTARAIQMGLLPRRPPAVDGYEIAGWSQPADQTGGDYYDWIELPGGRVIFTIADATGHGIGPALLVAACRAYFRAIAAHVDPLEQICAQVDELVAADVGDGGRFITAAVALLEPEEHRLSIYSAGQAPMYLYAAAADEVKVLDADQPPLGTMFGADDGSKARVMLMSPGDVFVMVTDGMFECASMGGDRLGIGRLGESVKRHRVADTADVMIRRMHDDVCAFSKGVPQDDDRTVVVIRRTS